jgi:hypothetical protein
MESLSTRERRERTIKAATKIAATYDIKSNEPILLKDSNNTVIHLAPSPVVAKVATSTIRKQTISNLGHELSVALHLVNQGAPIVPPSIEIPAATYWHDGLEVTFWQYCSGANREDIDHPQLVAALKEFHDALASYRGTLKPFTHDYEMCRALLDTDRLSSELSTVERQFLRQIYQHLSASLRAFSYECVPVHAEVHGGNVLWTQTGPRLIDFESCCRGPRELDFLSFSERNLSACPRLNEQLLEVLSALRSFRVAIWCWSQPQRAGEVREAAEYHLSRLHSLN